MQNTANNQRGGIYKRNLMDEEDANLETAIHDLRLTFII